MQKKSTPECKYVVLLLPACGYESQLVSATMRDQDHRLAFFVIPLALFYSMASYHSLSSTQLSHLCVIFCKKTLLWTEACAGFLLLVAGPSSLSWTYQRWALFWITAGKVKSLGTRSLVCFVQSNVQMLSLISMDLPFYWAGLMSGPKPSSQ